MDNAHQCTPADNAVDYLALGLQDAQSELASAEIALIEATARAEDAREAHARHEAASAALKGEIPVGPSAPEPRGDDEPITAYMDRTGEDTLHGSDRAHNATLTPEEFDKERKQRQKARQQEEIDNNPHGKMKCPGCGVVGKMIENTLTTGGGGVVKMLVCGGCKNQQLM